MDRSDTSGNRGNIIVALCDSLKTKEISIWAILIDLQGSVSQANSLG